MERNNPTDPILFTSLTQLDVTGMPEVGNEVANLDTTTVGHDTLTTPATMAPPTTATATSTSTIGPGLMSKIALLRERTRRRMEFSKRVIEASQAALAASDALLATSHLVASSNRIASSSPPAFTSTSCFATQEATTTTATTTTAPTPEACEVSSNSESEESLEIIQVLEQESQHRSEQQERFEKHQQREEEKRIILKQQKKKRHEEEEKQRQQQLLLQQALKNAPTLQHVSPLPESKESDASSSSSSSSKQQLDSSSSFPSSFHSPSEEESSSREQGSDNDEEIVSSSSVVDSYYSEGKSSTAASVEVNLVGRESPGITQLPISGSILAGTYNQKAPIPQFITSAFKHGGSTIATATTAPSTMIPQHSLSVQPQDTETDEPEDDSASDSDGDSDTEKDDSDETDSSSEASGDSRIEGDELVDLAQNGTVQTETPNSSAKSMLQQPKQQQQQQLVPSAEASSTQPQGTQAKASENLLPRSEHHAESYKDKEDDEASSDYSSSDGSEEESDDTESSDEDIEDDEYVQELLDELQASKSDMLTSHPAAAIQPPIGQVPLPISKTSKVPPVPVPLPAVPEPAETAPILLINDFQDESREHGSEEEDASEDEDSEDFSTSSSSEGESSDAEENEDDEYVDELLKELHATKPSTLVPHSKIPVPHGAAQPAKSPVGSSEALKKPKGLPSAVDDSCSTSDDDISDIESSSSSDSDSSDSDLFSSDDEDDDDEADEDEGGKASTGGLTSSEEMTSDDDDDDDYVDDLLQELQTPRPAPKMAQPSPAQPPVLPNGAENIAAMPPGMPMMAAPLPGEGLNLDAIRSELEKVGRAVMTQKSGEAFVARAQILASINQLSSHVPNCVLDFLGKEIRTLIAKKSEKPEKKEKPKKSEKLKMIDVVSSSDDMSEVSDLSDAEVFDNDLSINHQGDQDESNTERDISSKRSLLVRQKSDEALDEMFKHAREERSVEEMSSDFEHIFNSSNEYGLTKSMGSKSIASFASSSVSSESGAFMKRSKSILSRGSSAGTTSWGTNIDGKLPSVSRFECALLFVDISGFTKLSTLLDPETLSKVINSYFQLIVSKVYEFSGDIQKFAGDAIFCEWRVDDKHSMEFCVASATACASQIVDECSDFPVMAGGAQSKTGEPISSLNVHCALGAGVMIGVHIGDCTRRREYIFLGEPIDQLTWGADLAKHGELVVSPEAFRSLSLSGVLDFSIRPSESEPAIIAKRSTTMFKSELLKDYRVSRVEYAKSRGVSGGHVEGLDLEDLKTYQKLMALYVHPVVAAIHMDQKSNMKTKTSAQERHREEAELRRVFIMFIHPLITISEDNDYEVDLLNEIMNLTSTQLERYCGHLRQMIVDDKGLVLIGTFGLRGSTFPNMVAERALPATIALHNALRSQLGVDNRIGATFGEVYCGAVGGVKRHEYAVLGPSANLAARLMGSKNNPGILVECNIRRMASRKYAFNALPPVKAKGYSEPVPIFEPLSPLERSWGRIQPNFVGREAEIKALMSMARDIVSTDVPKSRLVFIASQSGMGKSTMVAHAIEHIRNFIGDSARRLVITKHVGKESTSLLPFGMFRSILLDVLANFAQSTDDKSHASGVSGFTSQSLSLHSLSCRSQGSSTALSLAKSEELLKVLCKELNAPSGFVDHVLHHLSGKDSGRDEPTSGRAPFMKAMVSFMVRAFRRCTEETKIVVVALDDVQYIDEMSWRVLRQVFEGCDNVLMVCAFDLSRSRDLKVEADFWTVLNNKYRTNKQFVPMELGGLGKEEITIMTMKTLGLQREEISPDLLEEVLIQSGGMPHFANEFLELVKRRQFTEMMDGRRDRREAGSGEQTPQTLGPNALGSVPEIILHRIDSFDVAVRNILNIAAVLGKSFTLKEVISVLLENHDLREDVLKKEAIASLDMACNEGIIRKEEIPDDEKGKRGKEDDEATENADTETVVYSFYHSIWQSTILSLMLDARKKDVHRKIALSLEKEIKQQGSDFESQMKLLGHWKSSGNTTKLTELALEIGKHFEHLALPTQSIRIYKEALDAWQDEKAKDKENGEDIAVVTLDNVGGITKRVLDAIEPDDLSRIASLHRALGRAFRGAQRNADSALSYHDALRIFRVPRNAAKILDRSTAFPAYFGLYESVKAKHILQEDSERYEQLLINKFLDDTRSHPEKFHHVHAITCQMDYFLRKGDMPKALSVQGLLYKMYDHVEHSKKLKATYGSDEAALSFANSAMWHWQSKDKEKALDACRFVIGKLMPKMDRSDVHQSFVMMYPIVLVMKETGVAVQARKHFDRLVVKPFSAFFGEGKSSFFLPVYEPILMLLHLVAEPDLDEDTVEEYADWALDRDRLCFGTLANRRLGALGRCADSLSAEICLLLAERIEDSETRRILIQHGKEISQEALAFNKEQELEIASEQVEELLSRHKALIDTV